MVLSLLSYTLILQLHCIATVPRPSGDVRTRNVFEGNGSATTRMIALIILMKTRSSVKVKVKDP